MSQYSTILSASKRKRCTCHYNFFRPHEALRDLPPNGLDKTPAQVAKADYPYKSWLDVVMGGRQAE